MSDTAASAGEQGKARIDAELDELNVRIMLAVQRARVTNFRTTRADIRKTLDIVREAAREIGESSTKKLRGRGI